MKMTSKGIRKPSIVCPTMMSILFFFSVVGCSKNEESLSSGGEPDKKSSVTAGDALENPPLSSSDSDLVPPENPKTLEKKTTPEEKISSFTGEWILADVKTAKAKWENFQRLTSAKKTLLTTGAFPLDLEMGRVDRELERASKIGKECVLTIDSRGNYSLNVNFVAEGYRRKEKGIIAWHSPFTGFELGSSSGSVLVVMMYQVDDCLVGGGILPFPNYWCMVRKKSNPAG